jgi:hypothetical protein
MIYINRLFLFSFEMEKNVLDTNSVEMNVYDKIRETFCSINLSQSVIDYQISKQIKTITKTTKGNDISNLKTIVILDRSGSMGNEVKRIINEILPPLFKNLGYSPEDKITIITFDSVVEVLNLSVKDMEKYKINCRGMTYMAYAIKELSSILNSKQNKYVRILAISDGELNDQEQTLSASSDLANLIKEDLIINSQAVRFFTSSNQPSTKGLSSILQLNTLNEANLVDISSKIGVDEIVALMSSVFSEDNLSTVSKVGEIKIQSKEKILKNSPWSVPSNSLSLKAGSNNFWLAPLEDINGNYGFSYLDSLNIDLLVGSEKLTVKIKKNEINNQDYEEILKPKVDYYFNQIKILKIIDNANSQEEIKKILSYFKDLDSIINTKEEDLELLQSKQKLGSRLQYIKGLIKLREKSVYNKMAELANDDKVNKLNSAQQADYLRNTQLNKNSKALAKRALNEGIDFDDVSRKEALEIYKNFKEIEDIDDSNHLISFYSTCTTMDGIRAICDACKSGLIDSMSVNDIIKLLNLVGLGCSAYIGDYPDPMVWRLKEIFTTTVSMSDILVAFEASKGKALVDLATKKDITAVIPIFENEKLQRFLNKYAPNLIEYTCSIGMRRIIANVPCTYNYTMAAGIWKLIEELNTNRSNIVVRSFCCLVRSFDITIDTSFSHIMPYLKEQDPKTSYYIHNNGITNMISPLINLAKIKVETGEEFKYMDRILRALYSFEIYQVVRKDFKGEDFETTVKEMLNKFLGIDHEKKSTPLPEYFVVDTNPVFNSQYEVNNDLLEKYCKVLWYLDYVVLLPDMLYGAYFDKKTNVDSSSDFTKEIEYFKNLPVLSEELVKEKIKIDYSPSLFKYFNCIQACIYNTKATRVDDDKKAMKFCELNVLKDTEVFLSNQVRTIYSNKYSYDLLLRQKEEKTILANELVESMISTDDINEYLNLFKKGKSKGSQSIVISDNSKLGFQILFNTLSDFTAKVPKRIEKFKYLILAKDDEGEIVWNNGNTLRLNVNILSKQFKEHYPEDYYRWEDIYEEYLKNSFHCYRKMPNRHGHSNDLPSYFAYGHSHIKDFFSKITTDEWNDYKSKHVKCCGIDFFLDNKPNGNKVPKNIKYKKNNNDKKKKKNIINFKGKGGKKS